MNQNIPQRSVSVQNIIKYTIFIIIACLFIFHDISQSASQFSEWGISQEKVLKTYLSSDKNFTKFSVSEQPDYTNKIMNYIVAIDSNLKDKITVIRSSKKPQKDFLFVNNRLYSVLVNHGLIKKSKLNQIIKKITSAVGKPSIQKDKSITIYSFKDKKTKILMLSNAKSNKMRCKTYYYASKLFRMLISE